jgi:ferric-dicitrate binding protein FerR (iron transport regulator)
LLVAGLLALLGYLALRPATASWKVLDVADGTVIRADGVPVATADRNLLARTLADAAVIEVERGDLVLQFGDIALFDLGEGARAAFGSPVEREDAVPLEVQAFAGRLRGRTGPGFRGRRMHVSADVMDLVVTGTAFAVDYEAEGTCVCCLHGEVEITSKALGSEAKPVPEGRMCLVYRSELEPAWGGPPDAHAAPLLRLEERARALGW